MQPEQKFCPQCHFATLETYYFCPNCGKSLKPAALSTSAIKQIGIFALSIFLPPLGFWPGVKYLLQTDGKAKTIGLIAIILTILSLIITSWLLIGWVNQLNQTVNQQLNQYQNLGF